MPWPVHPTGFFGARGDSDTYRIERSLRFNDDDAAYLSRTFGTPTDGKKCTLSLWYKRGNLGGALSSFGGSIFAANSSNFFSIAENSASGSDELMLWYGNARTLTSTAKFRDPSSWYHLVIVFDSTQATSSNRCRVYINGSEVTSWSTDARTNITLNSTITFNTASISALISGYQAGGVGQFDGYIAEYYFIDGQALTPSSFGETDAITGRWKAKAYGGTYGTNGYYLKFADNSGTTATTLGKDSSSNGNNWTPNNFSVTAGAGNDSLVDSPTNYGSDTGVGGNVRGNYCTLSAIDFAAGASGFTLTDGNLRYSKSGDSGNSRIRGTTFAGSGKYYWEYNIVSVGAAGLTAGIASTQFRIGTVNDAPYRSYSASGNKASGATSTSYGSSYTANDIIGLAVDVDAGTLVFYKNGTSQGTAFTDIAGSQWTAFIQGEAVVNCNFGQRPFAYTAPSGFKALCTQNLTQPTIQKPSRYMDALAYTGTGASNSISSLGFSPDLVWIKNRGTTTSHAIYDTTRGTQAQLSSNTTGDEVTSSTGLTSFDANGFTIGTSTLVNTSGTQYVAWGWDESVQAGMDIVSYTGNGANRTISHNLGVAPKMIIVKARTTAGADQGWPVWHTSIANTTYLGLNSTSATATGADYWNSSSPTSSVFSVGTNASVNANNDTYISYLFSEIEGYSKFGSYTGNGSADGPFAWCGFRPRWVMIKNSSSAYNWIVYDTARNTENLVTLKLAPNNSQEENGSSIGGVTFNTMDILSNGFKLRSTNVDSNASGNTIIFAAFAESPFKYARAR
jgi:hypothetical protein